MNKRIEYIDALRGFTMLLVVSVHVYSLCFMQGNVNDYDLSYNNFFGLFRMPLFFFISGFVFYKFGRNWDFNTLKNFIISKVRVQLFSTIVFFMLFCFMFQRNVENSIIDGQKAGYWFTYVLFIYFLLYIVIDKVICWLERKKPYNNHTIITTFIIGLFLYYFINNGYLLNILSPRMTSLLSISKWQYFLFFSLGCFVHKHYDYYTKFLNYRYIKEGAITLFVGASICIFYQNNSSFLMNNTLLKLLTALSGIFLIMYIFKANENNISKSTKLGVCLQYIGKRTLDIYFLHYFFLPYNMSYVGELLNTNPNPLLEFSISLTLALVVIVCCLFVSKIIRISPILTFFLLGGKKVQ